MKTPILYGKEGRIRRAVWNAAKDATTAACAVPKFSPAFVSQGLTFPTMKPVTTRYADGIYINPLRFGIARGKVKAYGDGQTAVTIDPEYVRALDALDKRISDLKQEREAMLDEAFRHGKPLTVADVKALGQPPTEKGE